MTSLDEAIIYYEEKTGDEQLNEQFIEWLKDYKNLREEIQQLYHTWYEVGKYGNVWGFKKIINKLKDNL